MKKNTIVALVAAGVMTLATGTYAHAAALNPASGPTLKTNPSDVVVAPGTGSDSVRLHFSGAQLLYRNSPGELTVFKANGGLMHYRPDAYQLINGKIKHVDVNLRIEGRDNATVEFGSMDSNAPVILKWGTVMSSQPIVR